MVIATFFPPGQREARTVCSVIVNNLSDLSNIVHEWEARNEETLDELNCNDHKAWLTQQAPIYGVQYGNEYCHRSLTFRLRDEPIFLYSNTSGKSISSTGDSKINYHSKLLFLGMACTEWARSYSEVSCGKVARELAVFLRRSEIGTFRTPWKILKFPNVIYAQGLECRRMSRLQFGLW